MKSVLSGLVARVRGATFVHWTMVAVLVVATVLRIRDLGAESLWLDELATLLQTTWSPGRIISESVVRGTPPLYYLLQIPVYAVLPASEWALRLLSAIADIVSVYLVYAVGRRVVGTWPAIVAAGFSAISLRLIWFAQEARAYSLGMMLSLLAVLTLLRVIERPSSRRMAVHVVVAIALIYTHVYSTFALIGIELWVLLSPRLRRRLGAYWWIGAAVAALAYVPWAVALVRQIGKRSELADAGGWAIAAPRGLVGPLFTAIYDLTPGTYRAIPYQGPSGWALPLFAAIVFFGLLGRRAFADADRQAPEFGLTSGERRLLLGAWAGMLLVGGILISQTILPIYSWRMATQAAPAVFLIASAGLRQLWRPVALLMVAAFLILGVSGLRPYYLDEGWSHAYEKEQWRDAVRYAEQRGGPGDVALVTTHWLIPRMQEYSKMLGADLPELHGIARESSAEEVADKLRAPEIASADRAVVVASHVPTDEDGLTEVERQLLANGWERTSTDDVRFIRLRTYERR